MAVQEAKSPFDCTDCNEKQQDARNCRNKKKLSDAARVVDWGENADRAELAEEHKEKGATKVFPLGNLRLYECPLTYLTEDTVDIMRLVFNLTATNTLYYAGGLADQPDWLVEALSMYNTESSKKKPTTGADSGK